MTTSLTRRLRWTTLAVATLVAATGCQFKGAASFPLPGGAGGGGYTFKAQFADVLDLVPQSSVKVNDVTVGSVTDITLKGYTAIVTMRVNKDVVLPANVDAALRQTSLLGEKFVSLDAPELPSGRLTSGATIPLARTQRNADVEEVLGALSLVLNGGSIEQLNTINAELTKALKGRESQVRDFLTQLTGFVAGLDDQKVQITHALDGLDRLSGKLAAQTDIIDEALHDIPQGAAVLSAERRQLVQVLAALNNLGKVSVRVINQSKANTVTDLQALQPILNQLGQAGQSLPNALELLTTYPFPRTVAGTDGHGGIRGDYANLFITIDGNLNDTLTNLLGGKLPVPLPTVPTLPGGASSSKTGGTTTPVVPKVLPSTAPTTVPTVPSLPGNGTNPLLPQLGHLLSESPMSRDGMLDLMFGGYT